MPVAHLSATDISCLMQETSLLIILVADWGNRAVTYCELFIKLILLFFVFLFVLLLLINYYLLVVELVVVNTLCIQYYKVYSLLLCNSTDIPIN